MVPSDGIERVGAVGFQGGSVISGLRTYLLRAGTVMRGNDLTPKDLQNDYTTARYPPVP